MVPEGVRALERRKQLEARKIVGCRSIATWAERSERPKDTGGDMPSEGRSARTGSLLEAASQERCMRTVTYQKNKCSRIERPAG